MPPAFRVELVGQATRRLKRLFPAEQEEALRQLQQELGINPLPRPPLIRKIASLKFSVFRLRLSIRGEPWRAFYRLGTQEVVVFGLVSKKEADRFIKNL